MSSVMLLLSLSKLISLMEGLKKKSYLFGTNCRFLKKESVQSPFFRTIPSIVMSHV